MAERERLGGQQRALINSLIVTVPCVLVTLALASRPWGAQVFADGRLLGTAPLQTTMTMSSDLVQLVARFPDGTEVAQAVVPDRPLPEIVFVKPAPIAATPVKRAKPPRAASSPKRTAGARTSRAAPSTPAAAPALDRDATLDPFR